MKKYFFYSATGTGIVSLQFPSTANSSGVAQNAKVYQIKLKSGGASLSIAEGDLTTETALIAAIVAAYAGAKVSVEDPNSKIVTLLN